MPRISVDVKSREQETSEFMCMKDREMCGNLGHRVYRSCSFDSVCFIRVQLSILILNDALHFFFSPSLFSLSLSSFFRFIALFFLFAFFTCPSFSRFSPLSFLSYRWIEVDLLNKLCNTANCTTRHFFAFQLQFQNGRNLASKHELECEIVVILWLTWNVYNLLCSLPWITKSMCDVTNNKWNMWCYYRYLCYY